MKHLLGVELACRKALAMAVLEQFIHLGPCFVKTPEVKIGTRDSLLFFPQSAVPERSLMYALPFEPLVAFSFRLLPGVVHAYGDPWIFLQDRRFNQQGVHDGEKARAFEIRSEEHTSELQSPM